MFQVRHLCIGEQEPLNGGLFGIRMYELPG